MVMATAMPARASDRRLHRLHRRPAVTHVTDVRVTGVRAKVVRVTGAPARVTPATRSPGRSAPNPRPSSHQLAHTPAAGTSDPAMRLLHNGRLRIGSDRPAGPRGRGPRTHA